MSNDVLVIGATGHVGRQVVVQLHEAGARVRAVVRRPERAQLPDGVTVLRGDLLEPETLAAAIPPSGVDAAFLVWPLATTDPLPGVLEALTGRVGRLVLLSSGAVVDADPEGGGPIGVLHARLEEGIRASGLAWTFLRPFAFAANTLSWAEEIKDGGVVSGAYGTAAWTLIHEADIAAVAVRALLDEDKEHTGAVHLLTGPETLTQAEQARVIGEVIGRPVRWQEITPAAARERLGAWLPPEYADAVLNAYAEAVGSPLPPLPAVAELTGRPARTFRDWVADHADAFRR